MVYRLLYFDVKGRGEAIKLLFAAANVDFEDVRVKADKWEEIKDSTPTGLLPLLEVDDKKLPESKAILRYLARKFKLEGANELEWAAADAIVCCISDMLMKMPVVYLGKDKNEKNEAKEALKLTDIPLGLKRISSLKELYGQGDYLVGRGLSYADIALYSVINIIHDFLQIEVELPENLKSLKKAVESNPGIADYLNKSK
ncbi:hypothetical protein GJ496_003261 [Pomphorhynchus laevis]|nr:hypothetical protein GJ496_003261 [Pomphorhynchus laevis]